MIWIISLSSSSFERVKVVVDVFRHVKAVVDALGHVKVMVVASGRVRMVVLVMVLVSVVVVSVVLVMVMVVLLVVVTWRYDAGSLSSSSPSPLVLRVVFNVQLEHGVMGCCGKLYQQYVGL